MTTHEVLVRARALIEREEDWFAIPDHMPPGGHTRCAVVALVDAAANRGSYWQAKAALCEAAGVPCRSGEIPTWNNSRTHAEVLAAFDKAIAATAPEPDTDFLNEVRVEEPVACP